MKIVAVAACPAGLMHTFMAAKALKKMAQKNKSEILVETQSASGIENQLTDKDVSEADGVILAIDTAIEGMDRFKDKVVVQTNTTKVLKNAQDIYNELENLIGEK
ncbi:PTS fructose transporter subunit IIB [Erysipelotrichaceae bacterium MTC7]|nr:PTS fructose transporter subunit IIB [Erysipelotrichaceae bacterium MTC7]